MLSSILLSFYSMPYTVQMKYILLFLMFGPFVSNWIFYVLTRNPLFVGVHKTTMWSVRHTGRVVSWVFG